MDIGVCVASHIGDVGYAVAAEQIGFSHAWFADSQMLWSDCYACLALAASQTSRIRLGTGVAISGTRPAPVNAAAIASINALAPGRTFFGVGAGNTAMRVMGLTLFRSVYADGVQMRLEADRAECGEGEVEKRCDPVPQERVGLGENGGVVSVGGI